MNKFESSPSTPQSEQNENLTHDGEPYSDATDAWVDQFLNKRAREENMELPDDKNPAPASEQEREVPRMFDSFDEVIEDASKSDDQMVRDFAKKINFCKYLIYHLRGEIDPYDRTAQNLYGECLFYLVHDDELVKKVYTEKCHKDIPAKSSIQDLMKELVEKRLLDENNEEDCRFPHSWREIEDMQMKVDDHAECSSVIGSNADVSKLYDYMNSLMHIMHTERPEIRDGGMRSLDHLLYAVFGHEFTKNLRGSVYFPGYEGLTGHGEVDKTVKATIEGYLEPIKDDLTLRISPTWQNSHLDNGPDYDYSINEDIHIDILAVCKESRDMALQILEDKRDEIEKVIKELDDRKRAKVLHKDGSV